jgi:hypothetical protein
MLKMIARIFTNPSKKEMQELRAEIHHLREINQWMIEAQERSEDPAKRKAKYTDTAPKAMELMRDLAFNTAYNDLMVDIQRRMLNSQPEQSELRETCYQESQCLQRLLLKLDYQVKVAQNKELKAV